MTIFSRGLPMLQVCEEILLGSLELGIFLAMRHKTCLTDRSSQGLFGTVQLMVIRSALCSCTAQIEWICPTLWAERQDGQANLVFLKLQKKWANEWRLTRDRYRRFYPGPTATRSKKVGPPLVKTVDIWLSALAKAICQRLIWGGRVDL